jgi:hypothetical protein
MRPGCPPCYLAMTRVGYLFGHPSVNATGPVNFFLSEFNDLGLSDTDAVALDLEATDGLPAQQVAAWGADVQSQLHAKLGRPPLLTVDGNHQRLRRHLGLAAVGRLRSN